MADPTKYQPQYNFSGYQAQSPDRPLPAPQLDNELANLASTANATIDALAQVRRSDGKLQNASVDLAALSDEVIVELGGNGQGGDGVIFASIQQALAGTSNAVVMSPLTTAAAIAAKGGTGGGAGGTGPIGPQGPKGDTGLTGLTGATGPAGPKGDKGDKGDPGTGGSAGDAATIVKAPIYYDKTSTRTDSKLFTREDVSTLDAHAYKLVEARSPNNPDYAAGNYIGMHVRHVAEGTTLNGPRGAALGMGVSMFKEGFGVSGSGAAKAGEIDGIYVVLRQDGPRTNTTDQGAGTNTSRSDACALLLDVAFYDKTGFSGGIEGATTLFSASSYGSSNTRVNGISYQIACINAATGTSTNDSTAYFAAATVGRNTAGVLINNLDNDNAYFDDFIRFGNERGTIFHIDRSGTMSFGRRFNNGDTFSNGMHMLLQSDYSLGWANADKSVQLMNLNQNGDLNVFRGLAAGTINTSGNVQASGQIIAQGKMTAAYIDLKPGGDPQNGASGIAGRLFVGPGGQLRYYTSSGQAKYVVTQSTAP